MVEGLSKTTIDNALASFSAVMRYALERDLIDVNPAYGMRVDPNDHRLRYKKTPRRRRWIPPAATTGVFLVPAVAGSNPVARPHEVGSRPGDPDHTLAHDVRAGGTSLASKCLFSQPRGGTEAGSAAAGWPRIADEPRSSVGRRSMRRAGLTPSARWRRSGCGWLTGSSGRCAASSRYRPLACEAIAPMQRKMSICRLEGTDLHPHACYLIPQFAADSGGMWPQNSALANWAGACGAPPERPRSHGTNVRQVGRASAGICLPRYCCFPLAKQASTVSRTRERKSSFPGVLTEPRTRSQRGATGSAVGRDRTCQCSVRVPIG
jgi:hypothetical protein